MYILNVKSEELQKAEILKAKLDDLPQKKDAWNFNWKAANKKTDSEVFILQLLNDKSKVAQGVLQLFKYNGMLSMELFELHPNNIGKEKKYDLVAG